jgi:DNA-binding CsgD family transcriptional regulator
MIARFTSAPPQPNQQHFAVRSWKSFGVAWGKSSSSSEPGSRGIGFALWYLGKVARRRGDHAAAAAYFMESTAPWRRLGNGRGVVEALEQLAAIATGSGEAMRAARLSGAASALREALGFPRSPRAHSNHQEDLAPARAALGEAAFAAAWRDGHDRPLEDALAESRDLANAVKAGRDASARSGMIVATAAVGEPSPGALETSDATGHGRTPRELDVLRLVATGRSNREIADALFISVPTVKRHLSTILGKLALPSRSSATDYAHTHHLV